MTALQDILETGLVTPATVAHILGTTPRSVTRWNHDAAGPHRREVIERMLELKAVLELAQKVMKPAWASTWLYGPVPALDYNKPLNLIRDGEYRRVIAALNALAERTEG